MLGIEPRMPTHKAGAPALRVVFSDFCRATGDKLAESTHTENPGFQQFPNISAIKKKLMSEEDKETVGK